MNKKEFLKGVGNWNNHLYLLWPSIENTSGPVVEFGCGHGSTQQLHDYCDSKKRQLRSYENNFDWIDKFKHIGNENHKFFFVKHWDDVELDEIDVLLIDQAPGERRKIDLVRYANIAKVVVLHDSEPAADHGYQCRQFFGKYKYWADYKSEGAWATVLSNFIDVTKFID